MAPAGSTVNLAERIRQEDRSAEKELVDRFYGRIYAMAWFRTRDREAARDLTQEVMLVVLCALREGRLRDADSLAGFVCATARNRINLHFRRGQARLRFDPPEASLIGQLDPEKSLENSERKNLAFRAIERLRPNDRKILRLTLVEGLKPREIAARLGLKPEVVRKRRSRAVQRAREAMRTKAVTKSEAGILNRGELL
jgi:RNA polymerase sigma-70 factor (ECF subfamily)